VPEKRLELCEGCLTAGNRFLNTRPELCDPCGVGGFLCATSRGFRCAQPRLLSVLPAGMGVCDPCGVGGSWAWGPGVSLRSTPGYYLPSLRDGGRQPGGLPDSSRRSEQRGDLRTTIEINTAPPPGCQKSALSCVGCLTPGNRFLKTRPEFCDPSGVGGFLCATSRGFRCAQPPATICHPCRDGGVRPLRGRRVMGVGSGGFATLNPRLLSAIPAGWGPATRRGCQTVAGGRSNAETSGE